MLDACRSLNDAQDRWTEGREEVGIGTGTRKMTEQGRIEAEMLGAAEDTPASLDPGLDRDPNLDRDLVADPNGLAVLAFLAPLMLAPPLSVPEGLVHVQALTAVIEIGPLTDIREITGTIDHTVEHAATCMQAVSHMHACVWSDVRGQVQGYVASHVISAVGVPVSEAPGLVF